MRTPPKDASTAMRRMLRKRDPGHQTLDVVAQHLFTRHDDAEARRIGTNSNPPSPAGDPPEPANTRLGSPASMPSAPGVAG
jgi:hypothetical protein